jgi:hypothetical protein
MIDFAQANIHELHLHHVGNKAREEELLLSQGPVQLQNPAMGAELLQYFLPNLNTEHWHHFADAEGEQAQLVQQAFADPTALGSISVQLAEHLYEQGGNPQLKAGELFVVYFKDLLWEDELADAIGIFKAEKLQKYISIERTEDVLLQIVEGLPMVKPDKGCLILNTEAEQGYLVAVQDATNKGRDTAYWNEHFLNVQPRPSDFYHTAQVIADTHAFVHQLAEEQELPKQEQMELMSRSAEYFNENSSYSAADFAQSVFKEPEVIDAYQQYNQRQQQQQFDKAFANTETDSAEAPALEKSPKAQQKRVEVPDSFEISKDALKSNQKMFKSVLKLDKNFSVYVHGNQKMMQRGFDPEKNLHYYTFYFKEEN